MIERLGVEGKQANGVWAGKIVFRCRWAHPVWFDYSLSVVDLDSTADTGPSLKQNPQATHEFLLYALDPNHPYDFEKPLVLFDAQPPFLLPANYGYQFVTASDNEAWARVNALVDDCMAARLSPDTDWRSEWDRRMADGWTLHRYAWEPLKPSRINHP